MQKTIAEIDCIHKLQERLIKNKNTIAKLKAENDCIPQRINQVKNTEKNQMSLNDLIIQR